MKRAPRLARRQRLGIVSKGELTMAKIPYAAAGSQRWLQIAVTKAPMLLDSALRRSGAVDRRDSVEWRCPLASDGFRECRDGEALRRLGIETLPKMSLSEFWPRRGPVWDALGVTAQGACILVEAKAHIPEAVSPPSKASAESLTLIRQSLDSARRFYAPRSKADWSVTFYQYANRLAFQYFLAQINGVKSRIVFLDFCNASDMGGPESEAEWRGATRLIHAQLGLPADLTEFGVFHAYVNVQHLEDLV
ncbi:MAG: hypothetical protein ACM3H9_06700 [Rhodospirillaceae bacterium]